MSACLTDNSTGCEVMSFSCSTTDNKHLFNCVVVSMSLAILSVSIFSVSVLSTLCIRVEILILSFFDVLIS